MLEMICEEIVVQSTHVEQAYLMTHASCAFEPICGAAFGPYYQPVVLLLNVRARSITAHCFPPESRTDARDPRSLRVML